MKGTGTETTKTTPYPKGLGLDSPRVPSGAAVLVSCWLWAVGCWLAAVAVALVALVAVVAAVGCCCSCCCCCCFWWCFWRVSASGAGAIKSYGCQCISATGAGGAAGVGTDVVLVAVEPHSPGKAGGIAGG